MIDRSEASGLSIAVIGHVLLFGLLSVGFLATPNPLVLKPEPIEVSLVGEVGLKSEAPVPSTEPLAARKSPVEAPVDPEPAPAEPVPEPEPLPVPKPAPAPPQPRAAPKAARPEPTRPAPKAPTRTAARPEPQRPAAKSNSAPKRPTAASSSQRPSTRNPVRPTGNLDGIDLGQTNNKTNSRATTPPAANVGPAVKRSLAAEVLRQIKPHWKPPSGADSAKLRTTVEVRLAEDGSIVGEPKVTQDGITATNRAQAALHRERAVRAVRLAAPFKLPGQFYSAWRIIAPTLYEDL